MRKDPVVRLLVLALAFLIAGPEFVVAGCGSWLSARGATVEQTAGSAADADKHAGHPAPLPDGRHAPEHVECPMRTCSTPALHVPVPGIQAIRSQIARQIPDDATDPVGVDRTSTTPPPKTSA